MMLINGIIGSKNLLDGHWQGFENTGINLTVDLGNACSLSVIRTHFMQNQSSWVFLPKQVKLYIASENRDFKLVLDQMLLEASVRNSDKIEEIKVLAKEEKIRYIRLEAESMGPLPSWHEGAGSKGWIFIDEIIVEPK